MRKTFSQLYDVMTGIHPFHVVLPLSSQVVCIVTSISLSVFNIEPWARVCDFRPVLCQHGWQIIAEYHSVDIFAIF